MFTGIVEAVGHWQSTRPVGGDLQVEVATGDLPLADVQLGDSIAVNGVCLTVVRLQAAAFVADVSRETLAYTSLGQLSQGQVVNVERALTPTSRLGGHIVSGHVDGLGKILSMHNDGRSHRLTVEAPANLARYIAHKGSIAVDGVSLTVNAVNGCQFELNIVPHTWQQTVMPNYQVGTQINLEVDVLARYLERLMQPSSETDSAAADTISESFLAAHGFMRPGAK